MYSHMKVNLLVIYTSWNTCILVMFPILKHCQNIIRYN